jgi:hypothetical protein
VVILGASNVARSLPVVVATAQNVLGNRLDILAAIGHGRGYGVTSYVLGRTLPPILECGLWSALQQRASGARFALLTDVGNDLMYGVTPERIAAWVEECVRRLRSDECQLVMTELPLASVLAIGRRRFEFFKKILFARSQITYAQALDFSRDLNQRLLELAQRYAARVVCPSQDWYGWDPIHIRRRRAPSAWRSIMTARAVDSRLANAAASWRLRWALSFLRPEERTLFGLRQQRAQPAARLSDGTWISLF